MEVEQQLFNRPSGELPYALMLPSHDIELVWMCATDDEGKITSVFNYNNKKTGEKERKVDYVESQEKAEYMKDVLLKEGWARLQPPKITISQAK